MTNPSAGNAATRETLTIDTIMAMIAGWMKDRDLGTLSDPDATFAEAGFDSMASVELAFFLQDELGVDIDDTVLYNHPTFTSLAQYLIERR